jgi:hypothetical protein
MELSVKKKLIREISLKNSKRRQVHKEYTREVISVKVHGPYSPSKDAFRGEGTPWLIKCSGEGNLSDVGHFNKPPHVWQLMAKHVDNNGREDPSSQETCSSDTM